MALFPVELSSECCRSRSDAEPAHLRGNIYVYQEQFEDPWLPFLGKRLSGFLFHYAIRYDLAIQGDTLMADSDIYMGALYRTRKLSTWRVPMEE